MSQDMSAMDDDMPHGGMDEHMQGDMDQHMAGDHAHEDIVYPPREGAREIVITMIDLAFEPDRLTLSAGETVNLLRSSVHRRRPC